MLDFSLEMIPVQSLIDDLSGQVSIYVRKDRVFAVRSLVSVGFRFGYDLTTVQVNTPSGVFSVAQYLKFVSQVNSSRHRAAELGLEKHFTWHQWVSLLDQFDHRCAFCRCSGRMTVEHLIPLSSGGSNLISNIRPGHKLS